MDNSINMPSSFRLVPELTHGYIGTNKTQKSKPVQQVQNYNSPTLEFIDPSTHGAIAQLINNHYLDQIKKDTKKVLMGRKLEAFLKRTFSVKEFEELPKPAQNLIRLHRGLSAAEIIRFAEFWDSSHEIIFKEYSHNSKFKALFEKLGQLHDVQMQAGTNNYVSLSGNFELRKKIESIFTKAIEKLISIKKSRKKRQTKRKRRPEE